MLNLCHISIQLLDELARHDVVAFKRGQFLGLSLSRTLIGSPSSPDTSSCNLTLCDCESDDFASAERSRNVNNLNPPPTFSSTPKVTESSSSTLFGVNMMSLPRPLAIASRNSSRSCSIASLSLIWVIGSPSLRAEISFSLAGLQLTIPHNPREASSLPECA